MRVGHNPARFVESVAQPAEYTVAVVTCLPFLSGFYEQGLQILKRCIYSIHESRQTPFDLIVFDNRSCEEVRQFLSEAHQQGVIQYLVLSDKNIGKIGAWNFMFGAAQGKYVAFADSDIYFKPGWLEESLALFEAFPNVGMVTARPFRANEKYSSATFEWAKDQAPGVFQAGAFLDWETFWEHVQSLGVSEDQAKEDYAQSKDYRLHYNGKTAYIGAGHFQFMARSDVLKRILPIPSTKPMRHERTLDERIDQLGLLRLLTTKAYVYHMGNRLPEGASLVVPRHKKKSLRKRIAQLPGVRHGLLWLYNKIFRLYFDEDA